MEGKGCLKKVAECGLFIAVICFCTMFFYKKEARADGEFGTDAYAYMEYLSTQFPQRWAGTEISATARNWLIETVQSFGYQEVQIDYCEGTSPFGWGDYTGYNLSFTKQGVSDRKIVVCAHYDSVSTNGADDNASGVGVLLETAKRVFTEELPYTVQFILFDAEEPGCLGSGYYVSHASQEYLDSILCVINIDTVAAGDVMYVYGGDVDAQGSFVRTWALWQVIELSQNIGIDLRTHPDVNAEYPSPTKRDGSDQTAFNAVGIPYVYFEASYWQGGNYTNFCQTVNPLIPNGKIMHVPEFDNLPFIKETFPNRAEQHLAAYSRILYEALHHLTDPAQVQPESGSDNSEETESSSEESQEMTEAESSNEESQEMTEPESGSEEPEEMTEPENGSEESTEQTEPEKSTETPDMTENGNNGEASTENTQSDVSANFSTGQSDGTMVAVIITVVAAIGVCGIIRKLHSRR